MKLIHSPDDNGYYWWRSCYADHDNSLRFEVSKKVYPTQYGALKAACECTIEWEEE